MLERMQALLVLLITAGLNAQAMILTVNDNRSHGAIGDSRLSLDEAIQLINLDNIARSGYLTTAGFSAAERAQLVPNLAGDDLIKLDGTAAPLISYERELTAVVTSVHQHQDVTILGLGNPTLDAKGFSAAFPVRTNHAQIIGMRITGGITAIEADSSLHYHPSTIGRFINLEISGQTYFPHNAVGVSVVMP